MCDTEEEREFSMPGTNFTKLERDKKMLTKNRNGVTSIEKKKWILHVSYVSNVAWRWNLTLSSSRPVLPKPRWKSMFLTVFLYCCGCWKNSATKRVEHDKRERKRQKKKWISTTRAPSVTAVLSDGRERANRCSPEERATVYWTRWRGEDSGVREAGRARVRGRTPEQRGFSLHRASTVAIIADKTDPPRRTDSKTTGRPSCTRALRHRWTITGIHPPVDDTTAESLAWFLAIGIIRLCRYRNAAFPKIQTRKQWNSNCDDLSVLTKKYGTKSGKQWSDIEREIGWSANRRVPRCCLNPSTSISQSCNPYDDERIKKCGIKVAKQ